MRSITVLLLILLAGSTAAGVDAKPSPRRKSVRFAKPTKFDVPAYLREEIHPRPPRAEEEFERDAELREQWFLGQRLYPFGTIPADARQKAWDLARKGRIAALQNQQTWRALGPAPTDSAFPTNWGATSGRINTIAVSPDNPDVILVGGATGGVWRSEDGGRSFQPTSDNQVDLAVGSIRFARSNPSIVYAAMGDGQGGYLGSGVLKSTDGGRSWKRISNNSLPSPGRALSIEIDPTDPDRVYLAKFSSLGTDGNQFAAGFYLSTDGGVSWRRTLRGLARDVAINQSNARTVYVAMSRVDQDNLRPGVYQSTDGGETWSAVFPSPFATTSDVRIGVTPADPNVLYAYTGGRNTGSNTLVLRIDRSGDGGQTWTNRGANGIDPGQFGYNTYLEIDPANADTLYVGSRDVYKSTNGGTTWTNLNRAFTQAGTTWQYTPTRSNAHPDQHCLAFLPGKSDTIFIGGDGGIYQSTDGGQNFQNLNATLALTMFVGLSFDPTENIIYGGTQDNGTQVRTGENNRWREFSTGDGGRTAIDPTNPTTVYNTYIYGAVYRNLANAGLFDTTVGKEASFGESAGSPRIAFYPPFVGNGVDGTLYFGSWRLFISKNRGNSWNAPADRLDLTRGVTSTGSDVLTAIGVSPSDTDVIYTGSRQGRAMTTTDEGKTWRDITAGLPNRAITSITVDPENPATAFVTVSGFRTGHVFKTTNAGAAWTDMSGNLPDIPVNAFLIDPKNPTVLYVGTDIGVFRSTTGGGRWESFNQGMPPTIVTEFAVNREGVIRIATYGRGAYELSAPEGICRQVLAFEADTPATVPNSGQAGLAASVVTTGDCAWTAVSDQPWLKIVEGENGTGNGRIVYSVEPNRGPARTATIAIPETSPVQRLVVRQPSACRYAVVNAANNQAISTVSVDPAGDSLTLAVNVTGQCDWSVTSTVDWITIPEGGLGNGTGRVTIRIAPNADGMRFGALTVAESTIVIRQPSSKGECDFKEITVGQTVDGALTTDSCAFTKNSILQSTRPLGFFTINATAGQQLEIRATSTEFDPLLAVFNPNGQAVASADDSDGLTPIIRYTIPTTGQYLIRVSPFGTALGKFQLRVTQIAAARKTSGKSGR